MSHFDELKRTLEVTANPAQSEQSRSTRRSRPNTGTLAPGPVIQMQVPLDPPELLGMGPPPIPQLMLEQEAESLPHTNRSEARARTEGNPPAPRRRQVQRNIQADSAGDATAQILERMQQLEQRLIRAESGAPAPTQNPLFASRPGPFTAAILQAIRPAYAKTPKMSHYGGLSDPFVHMDTTPKMLSDNGRKPLCDLKTHRCRVSRCLMKNQTTVNSSLYDTKSVDVYFLTPLSHNSTYAELIHAQHLCAAVHTTEFAFLPLWVEIFIQRFCSLTVV